MHVFHVFRLFSLDGVGFSKGAFFTQNQKFPKLSKSKKKKKKKKNQTETKIAN